MANQKLTVLLTLGRLPKALELARSLHAAGCRVIVADSLRWHLCRPSRAVAACYQVSAPNIDPDAYLRELLQIVARENVRMIVPVCEESLHVARLRDQLPAHVRLLCQPFKTLAQLHHKLLFAHLAQGLELAVPPTFPENSEGAQQVMRGDYVAKPAHSGSGVGVRICRDGKRHKTGTPGMLVQQYIDGDHISSLSFCHRGEELVTVLYRGTVAAGEVDVCFERADYAPSVRTWIQRYCEKSGYSGFIAFDFVVDAQEKAWAVECNPRPTSGVHFLEPGDLAKVMLAPHQFKSVELKPKTRMQWAYSTMGAALRAVFRPQECKRRLRELLRSRDVVWSIRDPLPFLLMLPMSWEIIRLALRRRMTLWEATLHDIAWQPGEAAAKEKPSPIRQAAAAPEKPAAAPARSQDAPQRASAAAPRS